MMSPLVGLYKTTSPAKHLILNLEIYNDQSILVIFPIILHKTGLIDGTSYIYLPELAACTIMVPDICDKSDGTVLMEGISMCSVTTLRFSCSP